MRWDHLFGDLEAQALAADQDVLDAEVADRTRREVGSLVFADRLRASIPTRLELHLLGGFALAGQVEQVGRDWFTVAVALGSAVVRLAAVVEIGGLGLAAAGGGPCLDRQFGIGHVLRERARDRDVVQIALTDGRRLRGMLERVGADFVDVRTASGERPVDRGWRTVAIEAIAMISPA